MQDHRAILERIMANESIMTCAASNQSRLQSFVSRVAIKNTHLLVKVIASKLGISTSPDDLDDTSTNLGPRLSR